MKLQKFENVDVITSLEAIMKQNTAFYQNDFDIDKQILQKAAVSPIPEDKRLLWFSRPSGTCCFRERDVFLKDTRQHNTWRFYGEQTCDTMSNLLLLEDDISLIDGLNYSLKKNGFYVDIARTIEEAEKRLKEIERYDLLILDVTLPDGTGFDFCENVRKQNKQIPIIFLTASDEEVNIIRGLDCGGDDYVTKPFKLGELCSRIRALLRRAGVSPQDKTSVLECGDISIDLLSCRVVLNRRILELTNAEYRLLCLLVRNANRIVSRDIILNDLWDSTGNFVDDNTLSVYIRRLREKVETDASHPQHLITIRGFGYQWKEV